MPPIFRAPHLGSTCFDHADCSGRIDDGFKTPSRCRNHSLPSVAIVTTALAGSTYSPRFFDTSTSARRASASRFVVNPARWFAPCRGADS